MRSAPSPSSERTPDSNPTTVEPVLYWTLLDGLDPAERADVIDAITRHDREVRAADAAGVRAVEAQ